MIRSLVRLPVVAFVAFVGSAIFHVVDSAIEEAELNQKLHTAQSNHARFEGTWTPNEMRLLAMHHRLDKYDEPVVNHAAVEGADFIRHSERWAV